jgi:putative transposase
MDPTTVPDDWCLPDELWDVLQTFLPEYVNTHPFGGGRPRTPDRVCANAIFYVLRTGCQWKALDATRFCPGSTAHDRFQEWVAEGVFFQLWKAGLLDYDCLKGIDWSWLGLDGCMTKAPLGGEKDGQEPHGSSEKRGQAQPAGRGPRGAGRRGGGRGQPPRPEDGPRNPGEHPGRASRANRRAAAASGSG